MAYSITRQNDNDSYGYSELVVDTEAEIINIPTAYAMGSSLLCIETGNVYILDSNKEWKLL